MIFYENWCAAEISAVHQITCKVILKIMPTVAISEILGEPLKKVEKAIHEHFTGIATKLETRPHFLHTSPSSWTTDTNSNSEL